MLAQLQPVGNSLQIGTVIEYRDGHSLTVTAQLAGRNEFAEPRFQIHQVHLVRIREDRNRLISENHVDDTGPALDAHRDGPGARIGLGRETGQEGPVTQRLERSGQH